MTGFTDVFGGSPVQPSEVRYRAIALVQNVSLFWPQQGEDTNNVIARWNDVTPSASGFSITFPSALAISPGQDAIFTNKGTNPYNVLAADSTLIATINPSTAIYIINSDNTTLAGTWQLTVFGGTASQVNAVALAGAGLIASSGQLKANFPISVVATNYTSTFADLAHVLNWTGGAGTITLENAATAGAGWFCELRNSGTGSVVVSPPSGTIDGNSSKTYAQTESSLIHTDGTNYYTVGYGRAVTSSFTALSVSVAGNTDVTLTSSQAQNQMLTFTGTLTGSINVIVPAVVAEYFVFNNTSGAFNLTFKASGGTGAVVIQGQRRIAVCDGTNIAFADTLGTGTVTQVNTGTGLSGGPITATGTVSIANTGVTAGSYTFLAATVNAQGQLTAASSGSLDTIGNVQGDILTRNASAWVALTPGPAGQFLQSAGAAANLAWANVTGSLNGSPTLFTTTQVYTPRAGTNSVLVWLQAPGGAGGGAATTGANQAATGGGGGGGEFRAGYFTSGFSGVTITMGAAGANTSGSNPGGPGGSTSFGGLMTAAGGRGGGGGTAFGGNLFDGTGGLGGSSGSGGFLQIPGQGGGFGTVLSGFPLGGFGGASWLGMQTTPAAANTSIGGATGNDFGAGGAGAQHGPNQVSALPSGAGGIGACIVWEFT